MLTCSPYTAQIDFDKYLDAYLSRPDAIRAIPSDAELLTLAHKAIVREQLVLLPLPAGEKAQTGDTAVLKTESTLPRFHKERVTVTLGRGLYSKELEEKLVGCAAGETVTTTIQEQPVAAAILELKRKQAPQPTDEMVAALETKTQEGKLITTVADYENYVREEKTMETLATVNYYVVEKIIDDCPPIDYKEEDIRALGELEKEAFIKLFQEQEGIDLRKQIPDGWKENGVETLDDFIEKRCDWYKMKIQQCLIFLNILGLPCAGKTDPLDHYQVLSELQMMMLDKIKDELTRRNTK